MKVVCFFFFVLVNVFVLLGLLLISMVISVVVLAVIFSDLFLRRFIIFLTVVGKDMIWEVVFFEESNLRRYDINFVIVAVVLGEGGGKGGDFGGRLGVVGSIVIKVINVIFGILIWGGILV